MKNSLFESVSAVRAPGRAHVRGRREIRDEKCDQDNLDSGLPERRRLAELLGLSDATPVENILRGALLDPLTHLTSNRGKRIRAQLVTFSYRLLQDDRPLSDSAARQCDLGAEAIELIHAGSLVVDDIEDGSPMRRGRPALHVRYPMPIALNAGNWLYFWSFELLKEMGLRQNDLHLAYDRCHRTLLRAHFGQALDLGAKVDTFDQAIVAEVCMSSMRLKTGALMGFAALLGGAIAQAPEKLLVVLDDFGCDLGVALQMFDDIGNVIGKCEPSKRFEDLILSRPSWVWATAARVSAPEIYGQFIAAVRRLPDAGALQCWLESQDLVEQTRASARGYLDRCFEHLQRRLSAGGACWSARACDELRALGEEIAVGYG
ncbi:MAG: polyprenyl synthetase family protein [Candidatus Binatia bacterium]